MNDLGDPLGKARGAIYCLRKADTALANAIVNRQGFGPANRAVSTWQATLDAELDAVEARIERLVRFVRAWDAHRAAVDNWQASPTWPPATQDDLDAARAAITDIER